MQNGIFVCYYCDTFGTFKANSWYAKKNITIQFQNCYGMTCTQKVSTCKNTLMCAIVVTGIPSLRRNKITYR